MTKEVKKVDENLFEITITLPKEEVVKATKLVASVLGESITLSGFRKGKAPEDLVVRAVGEDKVKEEVIKELLGPSLLKVLKEEKIVPIINPVIEKIDLEFDQPLVFTTKVTTYPTVKVTGYQSIKVKKPEEKKIVETDIDEVVINLFKQVANPPERENVILDSKGEKLTLGNKQEAKPDDQFGQKMGAKDLSDLKGKIKDNLQAENKVNAERDFETTLLEELVKKTKTTLPEGLIEVEVDNILKKIVYDLESMGMSFEDYLKSQNKKVDELRTQYRDSAIKTVTAQLALNEVAKLESLEVTDSEIEAALPKGEAGHVHSNQEKNQMHAWLIQRKALEFLKQL